MAGIGNVYADECLHHARIHPARRAGDLSQPEIGRLHAAIRSVLRGAIAIRNATGLALTSVPIRPDDIALARRGAAQ